MPIDKVLADILKIQSIDQVIWDGGNVVSALQILMEGDRDQLDFYRKITSEILAGFENEEFSRKLLANLYLFFNALSEMDIKIYLDLLKLQNDKALTVIEKKKIINQ